MSYDKIKARYNCDVLTTADASAASRSQACGGAPNEFEAQPTPGIFRTNAYGFDNGDATAAATGSGVGCAVCISFYVVCNIHAIQHAASSSIVTAT